MAELSDEVLMAYADGALDETERAEVARMLDGRPDLALRIDQFRKSGQALRQAFGALEPAPADLVARIRSLPVGTGDAEVTDLAAARAARAASSPAGEKRGFGWTQLAMAASLALVVGLTAGWVTRSLSPGIEVMDGTAGGALRAALETGASGRAMMLGGGAGATVTPIATMKDKAGRFCRHYEVARSTAAVFEGIACRGEQADWTLRYYAEKPPARLAPAEGGVPRPPRPIEAARMRMGIGEPLDAAEDERHRHNGWKP